MRIVMPLFNFNYEGCGCSLSDIYSIALFDMDKDIPAEVLSGLSENDKSYIYQEDWALVANDPDLEYYKQEINLLLIAFRIYSKCDVFIKWRFCKDDPTHCSILNDKFRNLVANTNKTIDSSDLMKIKHGFVRIKDMFAISDRTKNAFYFIWRALSSDKHMDAYIFLVCALESLFSAETTADITKTFTKRIQRFVSGTKGFGGDQIKKIYKIRSDMVHGRIKLTDKQDVEQRKMNLNNLGRLETLVFTCLYKILEEKIYTIYKDNKAKENYLTQLMN